MSFQFENVEVKVFFFYISYEKIIWGFILLFPLPPFSFFSVFSQRNFWFLMKQAALYGPSQTQIVSERRNAFWLIRKKWEDSCFALCVLNCVIFSVAEDGVASCCSLGGLISTEHLQRGLVNEPAVWWQSSGCADRHLLPAWIHTPRDAQAFISLAQPAWAAFWKLSAVLCSHRLHHRGHFPAAGWQMQTEG